MPPPVEFIPSEPEAAQPESDDTPVPTATPVLPPAPAGAGKQSYDADLPGYAVLNPVYVDASSALNYYGKVFKAEYVSDGDIATCWQEAAAGNGIGEYLTMDFGQTVSTSLIRFRIGYAKDDTGYYMNNRPSSLWIEFSDGQCISCAIPDENDWYTMYLPDPVYFDWVRFTIDDVYGGDEYPDTCISEIVIYTEGADGPLTPQQPADLPSVYYKEPYASYIRLLETNCWATDFGIDLNDSSRLEGFSVYDFWDGGWNEYLDEYPVNYFVCDLTGDGVDELVITGNCMIGYIEDCFFFSYRNSQPVYLGSVEMTPGAIFRDEAGFILHDGATDTAWEARLSFNNGVPEIGQLQYFHYEDPNPIERGLETVQYCFERNAGLTKPYLDPLYELGR